MISVWGVFKHNLLIIVYKLYYGPLQTIFLALQHEGALHKLFPDRYNVCRVQKIMVHPVKSFKGISVDSWEVDEFGFKYDRMYTLAVWKDSSLQPLTQRECPMLSQIEVVYRNEFFEIHLDEKFWCKLPTSPENLEDSPSHSVQLWGVSFKAFEMDFSSALIERLHLPASTVLLYSKAGKFVKTNSPIQAYRTTKFQDYFPLLLMTTEDFQDLNSRLEAKGHHVDSVDVFRPNLLISNTIAPYDTDDWYRFEIVSDSKPHQWLVSSKCPRCQMPNMNLETGSLDPKATVTKTLASYRRCDLGNRYYSFLGIHAVQLDTNYTVRVGDSVRVLERRLNYYKTLT